MTAAPRSAATTRVTLVEDHALLAEALLVSLSLKGFQVHSARPHNEHRSSSLLNSIMSGKPHVVLLDLDLGEAGDGGRLIEPLTRAGYRVVVLTACTDRARWGACLASGALTVLTKSVPLQVIVDVLLRVAQGLPVLSRLQRSQLIHLWIEQRSHEEDERVRLNRLTPRECHVLGELVQGKRVRQVAQDAFVSEATVRTQVKSILAKLGVSSQLAAVAMARDAGWGSRGIA